MYDMWDPLNHKLYDMWVGPTNKVKSTISFLQPNKKEGWSHLKIRVGSAPVHSTPTALQPNTR